MPLDLPDITLVIIDSVASALSRLAIEDTLEQITPDEILVFGDPEIIRDIGLVYNNRTTLVPRTISSLAEVARILWYEVPLHLSTSHFLVIQYDGFVLDASRWTDQFLSYDYIGAPWPWHQFLRVGNGGFSLRSKKLGLWLIENRATFPFIQMFPEDDLLCRHNSGLLAKAGLKIAPETIAWQFSFERLLDNVKKPPIPSFGFHGIFNWPHVLSPEKLEKRKSLANDFVKSKVEWKELLRIINSPETAK